LSFRKICGVSRDNSSSIGSECLDGDADSFTEWRHASGQQSVSSNKLAQLLGRRGINQSGGSQLVFVDYCLEVGPVNHVKSFVRAGHGNGKLFSKIPSEFGWIALKIGEINYGNCLPARSGDVLRQTVGKSAKFGLLSKRRQNATRNRHEAQKKTNKCHFVS